MVEVLIPATGEQIARGGLGQVSIATPTVADERNAAKASAYKQIASYSAIVGDLAEKRFKEIQARKRAEALVTEDVETRRMSRTVLEEAQKIQDDEQVLPFIQDSFQKRLDALNERYSSDPDLQVRMYQELQQESIRAEDAAFNFVEQRQRSRHLATMEQGLFDLKNSIVYAPNETARALDYEKADMMFQQAVELGYLDADDAVRNKLALRQETVSAIIGQAVTEGRTGYAAGYLEANKQFLKPTQTANYKNVILNEQRRQVKAQRAEQERAVRQTEAFAKAISDGGLKAGDALVKRGMVKPGDLAAIYSYSGGSAAIDSQTATEFMNLIRTDREQGLAEVRKRIAAAGPLLEDQVFKDMEKLGLPPSISIAIKVGASPYVKESYREAVLPVLDTMSNPTRMREVGKEIKGEALTDLKAAVVADPLVTKYLNTLPAPDRRKTANLLIDMAKVSLYENPGDTPEAVVTKLAGSFLPESDNYVEYDGQMITIPSQQSIGGDKTIPLRKQPVITGLEIIKDEWDFSETIVVKGGRQRRGSKINSQWRKIPAVSDARFRLVDDSGEPVLTKDGKTIEVDAWEAQAKASEKITAEVKKNTPEYERLLREDAVRRRQEPKEPLSLGD